MASLDLPPVTVAVTVPTGLQVWTGPPVTVALAVRSGIGLTVSPIATAISLAFTAHATGSLTQATP
jgi:hypothetical protein